MKGAGKQILLVAAGVALVGFIKRQFPKSQQYIA